MVVGAEGFGMEAYGPKTAAGVDQISYGFIMGDRYQAGPQTNIDKNRERNDNTDTVLRA